MLRALKLSWLAAISAIVLGSGGAAANAEPVDISIYYPIAIGGPVTKIIGDLTARFEKSHPDIRVKPVYAGTYQETISKALTAFKSGRPPELAVMLSTEMYTLVDQGAIVPFDGLAKSDDDKKWLKGFMPIFMLNSEYDGKTWGVPFQRGTTVFFWNKDAFKKAGLDPSKGPQNWQEVIDFAKMLTKQDASGNVTQWGMQVPASLTPYWELQGYVAQNGGKLVNETGDKTYLDSPEVIGALQYWVDLSHKYHVMKPGVIEWATNAKDFFQGRAAMMTTTSGNLTNVKDNAPFPFGVEILPANKKRGAPTSGGNIYLMKGSSPEKEKAAFEFARWLTSAQQSAEWSIATGYIAPRDDAWATQTMKDYVKAFPGADVPRQQIPYLVKEFSTHENERVAQIVNNAIEAALTNSKTPADALKGAQQEIDRILRSYR